MDWMFKSSLFALLLFAGMLAMLEVGHRAGLRRLARSPGDPRPGLGAVEGAVFALMGLLVAFTFSGAASRFDVRRALIVQETNDVGTAYLRLELLPPAARDELKARFRTYLDARLEVYRRISDERAAQRAADRASDLGKEIWQRAVSATQELPTTAAAMLLLPAINAMLDTATTRVLATSIHPPAPIFALLGALALVCSLLAGYAMAGTGQRSWLHSVGFALTLALTVYVILDLEYPRLGLFQLESLDQALVDLRAGMR